MENAHWDDFCLLSPCATFPPVNNTGRLSRPARYVCVHYFPNPQEERGGERGNVNRKEQRNENVEREKTPLRRGGGGDGAKEV